MYITLLAVLLMLLGHGSSNMPDLIWVCNVFTSTKLSRVVLYTPKKTISSKFCISTLKGYCLPQS